jgi:hypothetical protein
VPRERRNKVLLERAGMIDARPTIEDTPSAAAIGADDPKGHRLAAGGVTPWSSRPRKTEGPRRPTLLEWAAILCAALFAHETSDLAGRLEVRALEVVELRRVLPLKDDREMSPADLSLQQHISLARPAHDRR